MNASQPTITILDQHAIRQEWEWIREGLWDTQKYGDAWLAEDVYAALMQGAAQIHVVDDCGEKAGFIVTSVNSDFQGPLLHIWVAHATGGVAGENIIGRAMRHLKEHAFGAGIKRIQFWSPRNGWERRAKTLGFAPKMMIYELQL